MQHTLRRWALPALLTLAAVCAFVAPAHAAWKYEELKWHHYAQARPGPYGYGGSFFVDDTTWVSAGAARVDTTAAWSMLDCEGIPPQAMGLAPGEALTSLSLPDSIPIAHFVLVADSSVSSSVNFKNTTVTLQVNYGSSSAGWQNFNPSALSPLNTDGSKVEFIPIWRSSTPIVITSDIGDAGTVSGMACPLSCYAPGMRAIVTWGTSAAVPSCRGYVRKWIGMSTLSRQAKDR